VVTGANGFVGRRLVAELLDAGVEVRAMVRAPYAGLARPGLSVVHVADLSDAAGIRRALEGVDAVVHLAARVHVMREVEPDPLLAFRRVNVEGSRVLLEEAIRAGARSFVYVSSVKAMGEESASPFTEFTPPVPVDPYGISKLEAELIVRERAAETGIHAPILRLPLVYGPGVGGNMLRLFQLVDRGLPLPLGGIRNRRSMAFVGNVAAALRALLARPEPGSETYLVSDFEDLSTPELIRRIAASLGRPARLVPVPESWFRFVGRVGDLASRVAPVPLSSAAVHRLLGSLVVDPGKIQRTHGFRPPYTVAEGLRETGRWYLEHAARR
jgi:nucleoside-diphosphate-sugar epimerase